MDNPRPDKVAVVDEVRRRFDEADAAILTEYRGLKVKDLASLRRSVRSSGGDYKIYKNTLVRLAARGSGLDQLEEMLVGPTAIAFVAGDAASVAKVLRDYGRTNPLLVIKGGVLANKVMDAQATAALAELPPRDVLLARFAGALAAPMQQLAGLLQALPRNLAYGLAALRDKRAEGEPSAAEDVGIPTVAESGEASPPASAEAGEASPPASAESGEASLLASAEAGEASPPASAESGEASLLASAESGAVPPPASGEAGTAPPEAAHDSSPDSASSDSTSPAP
jgi:large subunit ribosomal protein L10